MPNNQRTLFAFSSVIKALATTITLVSLVFYLSLFFVLCSCNKIHLLGISCSAFSFFCCYCWGPMSYPPIAVNFVLARDPPHSSFFVLSWRSGNNHWVDLWAVSMALKRWNLTIKKIITFSKSTFRSLIRKVRKWPLQSLSDSNSLHLITINFGYR